MENKMTLLKNRKGVSLIAAIFIIVVLAFMGTALITMVTSSSIGSIRDLQSVQALYVAQGGTERAKLQFASGTICVNLTNTNIALGAGTFTTAPTLYNPAAATLSAAINATATTIPVTSTAGYAPQGRITIDSETIWYGRIAGNSFLNARRGVGGTTAAAHTIVPVPPSVTQNQCRIVSTGSVGNAQRTATLDMQGTPPSGTTPPPQFFDGPTTLVNNATTSIGSLTTTFGLGDNLIIAIVVFQNTTNNAAEINTGNLQLRSGATLLDWNRSLIRVDGPATNPGTLYNTSNIFAQKTQFLLYRHTGAPANPTYNITAQATANNRIYARVKMIVLHNVPFSYGSNDGNVRLSTAADGAVLSTHATGIPAGNNLVLAAVQLDQTTNTNNDDWIVDSEDLRLRRGDGTGPILNSNTFDIGFERSSRAKRGLSYLLIALDDSGAANQTYTVTGRASHDNSINGAVSMLVLQGLPFANYSTPEPTRYVDIPAAVTTLGSVATTFSAGNNVAISATQMMNYDYDNRNILTDQLVYGGGGVTSSNVVPIYLQGSLTNDDYATGLLLYHPNAPANPTYNWQAQSDPLIALEPIRASTDMAVINFGTGGGAPDVYGWQ